MVNNSMKNRSWRTKDIAAWIDLAVLMVLCPTRAELTSEMLPHSAAWRDRVAEYAELRGAIKRC